MIRTALALTRRTTLTRLVRPLKRALSTRAQPALAVPRAAAKLSGTARAEGEEPILDIWSTLKVDAPLATGTRRCKCPKCNTAVSYYCAKCLIPIAPPDANANASAASASASQSAASPLPVGIERLPVAPFRLPIDVDILHDRREKLTQSSAVHAAVLCPQQVRLLPFRPTLHDKLSFDPQSTLLLYPDPKAPTVSEIDPTKFTRAVAIDSRWRNANSVLASPLVSKLQRVRINKYHSRFWRYQTEHPRTALATVEAIYYLCRELHIAKHGVYNGEFDNLLFYFHAIFNRVQNEYVEHPERKFTSRHWPDYIDYSRTRDKPSSSAAAATQFQPSESTAKANLNLSKAAVASAAAVASTVSGTDADSATEALWAAVKANKEDDVAAAIKGGADVNATDADGNTILHFLAKEGHRKYPPAKIPSAFIAAKANLNATNKAGQTPLQVACLSGWQDIAELYIKSGADTSKVGSFKANITCPDVKRMLTSHNLFP